MSGGFERIVILKGRCPVCRSDVAGSDKYKYYCRKCNLLFESQHLENPGNPFGTIR